MSYQQKDNSGSLFKNDKKETDQHPDYTGSGMVAGVDYYFDAWINTAESGRKYMSVKFKPKNAVPVKTQAGSVRHVRPDADSDIPF